MLQTNTDTMKSKKITKAARKEFVRAMLKNNKTWALRALVVIYAHQTVDEQSTGITSHENGVGFSGSDSEILSSFAVQYQRRGWLTYKQMTIVFRLIPKYWRQVIDNADLDKIDSLIIKHAA